MKHSFRKIWINFTSYIGFTLPDQIVHLDRWLLSFGIGNYLNGMNNNLNIKTHVINIVTDITQKINYK